MNNNKIEEQFLQAVRLHSQWEEVWLNVRGYPNYEVSTQGSVRNLKTKKIMKQRTDQGYRKVNLYKNGEQKRKAVHRIVCEAFNLNPHSKSCVDHIDRNTSNNHLQNLRWATRSENQMNRSKQSNNTSGVTGVHWNTCKKKWFATIKIDGVKKHLGCFDSIDEAKKARITAVDEMFGSFANPQTNK